MRRLLFVTHLILLMAVVSKAQVSTDPSCFQDDTAVRIIYNANEGTSNLQGAAKVYMHSGVITDGPTGTDWQHVVGNWPKDDGVGQMSRVDGETDLWEITITPRTYYDVPTGETIYRLGMVFRNADGSKEGKNDANGDIFVNLATSAIELNVTNPSTTSFVDNGSPVSFSASTCGPGDYTLYIDDVIEHSVTNSTSFEYDYLVNQPAGDNINARLEVTDGTTTSVQSFEIFVRSTVIEASRPTGILDGINYDADPTRVTLSLWAPLKSSVYLLGDFNGWQIDAAYLMKKDG